MDDQDKKTQNHIGGNPRSESEIQAHEKEVIMDDRIINGTRWFHCTHLTNGMRKWYRFRMIGKKFYATPKNLKKQ